MNLGMQHLSEAVFVEMCYKVGTSQSVRMRREMLDFRDMIKNQVIKTREENMTMVSGSHKEGFRLEGSDVDFMIWPKDHIVIWDLNQAQNYDLRKTLILCDCSESPPGFGLLELLTSTHRESVKNACIKINDRLYISSSKYRQITCSADLPNFKEHGPSGSGVVVGGEHDHAQCFVCNFWPPPASKWIDRCHACPPSYIVYDIVSNGCHFVAIGHKLGQHADKEWRISFSLAEQKLVYSMNQCQFLTYGLLKLFLKESINHGLSDEDKLLCSYHMKTAVFWVIQQNKSPQWHPQNLMQCFWVCFKLILKWVYEGVCPNFFIPENNMFLGKIYGEAQNKLFFKLYKLYEKGLVSLLHIPSISYSATSIFHNLRLSVGMKPMLISKVLFELDLFEELFTNHISKPYLNTCMKFLNAVEKLMILPLTQYQVLMLQKLTSTILQRTAFIFSNIVTVFVQLRVNTSSVVNKQVYRANKRNRNMLKLAAKFGCISGMLYIAMFYYKALRYKEALSIIEMTKVKLSQPYVRYVKHLTKNALLNMFNESLGGLSWSKKLRDAVAWDIVLENRICYINELVPEQQSGLQCGYPILVIPIYVVLHMLEVLCYRHVDPVRAQSALDVLQNLVHNDQWKYMEPYQRDISWEILGICQQVTLNHEDALNSYLQSLRHSSNNIQTATVMRLVQEITELVNRNQT
ncbi:uncharacterized protein LOC134269160 [Saccostrea cucullata]|uniref:uncharacterized protein LOC134269160 n=1 Tax=Saccostrea cuccullata TaxID=36930 RepID=UPI002ED25144